MTFEYYPRIADAELAERLSRSGAVVIRGAKWCGKTETAKQQAKSILYLQDPDNYERNMLTAQTKPSLLLRGDQPRLIDEWQDAPQLWDAVRFSIDQSHGTGHFILTGSASKDKKPRHSGVGRMSLMTMRPMSLAESRDSSCEVSLQALFGGLDDIDGSGRYDIEDMATILCRGGWPEAVTCGNEAASLGMARDYVRTIAEEDISDVDGVQRNYRYAMLTMAAYARCVSTRADMTAIRGGIKAQGSELSRNTVDAYVSALRRLYVLEDLPAWRPSLRDKTRVAATPARHFVDPSLAAAAMNATPALLLQDMPTMGTLFESLCVRDLRIYAQSLGGDVYHYRDDAGREADSVIVLGDGRWALVEIKTAGGHVDEGAANLIALADKIDQAVMGSPTFLMVLTATQYAYRRPDGVFVVPIDCLCK